MRPCSAVPQRGQARGPVAETLPQARQPTSPAARAVSGGRSRACHTVHSQRLLPSWTTSSTSAAIAQKPARGRCCHAADLDQATSTPIRKTSAIAQGFSGVAARKARAAPRARPPAEAERQERVGERGGAQHRDHHDQQGRGHRERQRRAGERQRRVEHRGAPVQPEVRELQEREETATDISGDAGEGGSERAVDRPGAVGHQHRPAAPAAHPPAAGTGRASWSRSQVGQASNSAGRVACL